MADASLQEGDDVSSGTLYRRIFPHRDYFKDGRPTSLNFLPDSRDADVSLFLAAQQTVSDMLEGHEGFGLLELDAAVLVGLGKRAVYTPSHGKGHVSVYGFSKKDPQARRDAAFASRVLIAPTLPNQPAT